MVRHGIALAEGELTGVTNGGQPLHRKSRGSSNPHEDGTVALTKRLVSLAPLRSACSHVVCIDVGRFRLPCQ